MTPVLSGVDHIHVNVSDRAAAEEWYQDIFGFKRVAALLSWATQTGPLTVEDPSGSVHLAIFEREEPATTDAVAFGATGKEFLNWKSSLEEKGLELRVADHSLAYSLYFGDPWGNSFEITTYERDFVAEQLSS